MSFTLVTTADGSVSCLDSETGELCHNRVGAYTEALKNYVEPSNAIKIIQKTGQLRLLDACYGMGYNTWVLINELLSQDLSPFTLSVTAIERSPEILDFLPHVLGASTFDPLKIKTGTLEHNIDYRTHWCASNTKDPLGRQEIFVINIVDCCRIEIQFLIDDLRQVVPNLQDDFDLVFHDAFSAQKMPELWTIDLFREYHRLLQKNRGKVLTYSSAAAIRGGFMEAGFNIGKTPALGAKNGGTIAGFQSGQDEQIGEPLSDLEAAYLTTRAAIPYRDPSFQATRQAIIENRFYEQGASNRPSGGSIRKVLI